MDSSCRLAVVFVLTFAIHPIPALGQGLTGSLSGLVKDEQGGTVAAATVTVASPAQIGGEQRATTDDRDSGGFLCWPRAYTSWSSRRSLASRPIGNKASASGQAPRSIGR